MSIPSAPDAVALEVFRHLFTALAEEMGAALKRASFSPNVKERQDYSCALFNPAGCAVSVGDHMPVHLGAMPMSVEAALEELGSLDPGDVVCVNDPFRGGTHLPDITLMCAVHGPQTRPLGYVASRAHHSDVGGSTPGSMPLAREIFEEGIRIPPVRLYRAGVLNNDLWNTLLANVRTPVERAGDLDAQLGALHAGSTRLLEIVERRGVDDTLAAMDALIEYADRLVEAGLEKIPDGRYEAEDFMEDDGFGSGPVPVKASLTVQGPRLDIDFTGTSPQVPGGINAVAAVTSSVARYVVRCVVEALLGEPLPAGGGSMSAVTMELPDASLVNAVLPASVAAGNVETSQRITDVLMRAFGVALPELMPALSQGTMNNITVGGIDPRNGRAFAYYETVGGGMGAGPTGAGLSRSALPYVQLAQHAHRGARARVSLPCDPIRHPEGLGRRGAPPRWGRPEARSHVAGPSARGAPVRTTHRRPAGAQGGEDGAPGENVLIRDGVEEGLPGKATFSVNAGDVISIRSPGGGGWGVAPEESSQN